MTDVSGYMLVKFDALIHPRSNCEKFAGVFDFRIVCFTDSCGIC